MMRADGTYRGVRKGVHYQKKAGKRPTRLEYLDRIELPPGYFWVVKDYNFMGPDWFRLQLRRVTYFGGSTVVLQRNGWDTFYPHEVQEWRDRIDKITKHR